MCPLSSVRIIGEPGCALDEGSSNPIDRLNTAADKHLRNDECLRALHCAEEAARLADLTSDRQRKGCALIRQAEIHRAQRHIEDALDCYRRASESFDLLKNGRNRVVTWSYIAELHRDNQEWNHVIQYCQLALEALKQLEDDCRGVGRNADADTYVKWQHNIQQALNDALEQYEVATGPSTPPPPPATPAMPPAPTGPAVPPRAPTPVPVPVVPVAAPQAPITPPHRASPSRGWVEFTQLPVLREPIPAGAPRDLTSLAHDNGGTDQLVVYDKTYEIISLRGDNRTLFTSGHSYAIVPVIGDSMDQKSIIEGDYVVLHVLDDREKPVNHDIVAAEVAEEHQVTLKQFVVANSERYLQACSSNPEWQNYIIEVNDDVWIRGIAVAILKPLAAAPQQLAIDELLACVDDLHSAEGLFPEVDKGLVAIRAKFQKYLAKNYDLTPLPIVPGQTQFDAKKGHFAASSGQNPSLPHGVILKVVSDGYTSRGKLFREAKVIINQ